MAESLHVADRRFGGGRLYRSVLDYLRHDVASALFVPAAVGKADDVYAAAASLTEIAGWMAHDSGRDAEARAHFEGAYRLSLAAGSPILASSMCASLSHLAHQLGQSSDALRFADVGLDCVGSVGGAARVSARLHAMRAVALADQDDHRGCRSELQAAERSLNGADDHEDATWAAHFDEGSLAAETARALQRLADHAGAERHARRVLVLRDGDRVRSRAFGRLSLAEILLASQQMEAAADLGRQVARVAPTLHSARVRTQLDGLAATVRASARSSAATSFLSEVAAVGRYDVP